MTYLAVLAALAALIFGVPALASLPLAIAFPLAVLIAIALVVIERRLARSAR